MRHSLAIRNRDYGANTHDARPWTDCGTDAGKWTEAFIRHARKLMDGSTPAADLITDFDWLHGWFANAMMAMHDDAHRRHNERLKELIDRVACPPKIGPVSLKHNKVSLRPGYITYVVDNQAEQRLLLTVARMMRDYIKEGAFHLDRVIASQDLEEINEALALFDGAKTEPVNECKADTPKTKMHIEGISLEVAKNLLDIFGGDETDMTVEFTEDGHSGTGFYGWCTEYPEDGSTFLGKASEHSSLPR